MVYILKIHFLNDMNLSEKNVVTTEKIKYIYLKHTNIITNIITLYMQYY